ncbi:hypothetical protein FACS1894178_6400 [Bacteroidia bacterium]|nr:hypothetical protein FACS1894178_6400 [Bacteroidia bacterium]
MKNNKYLEKIVAGVLIPSVLLPSCTPYFVDGDPVSINNVLQERNYSAAVPIDIKDRTVVDFLIRIVSNIIQNPALAQQFAEDPNGIAQSYGLENFEINFDDGLWKLVVALGDADIHRAIITQDIALFFELCETKGIMEELRESDFLKYSNLSITDDPSYDEPDRFAMVGGAVVFLIVAAGCAAVGANSVAVWNKEYAWDDDKPQKPEQDKPKSLNIMVNRDLPAYQLWVLKNGTSDTYTLLSAYQEKLVNDCITAMQKYFPDKIEGIGIEDLRNFIAINMLNNPQI